MRNRRYYFSFLLAALTLPPTAHAICTRPAPKLCSAFFTHELVIRAKVLKIEQASNPRDPAGVDGWNYHVEVIKTYRGTARNRATIRANNTTARLLLAQGKEYVIFAYKNTDDVYEASGNCSGIQPLEGERYSTRLDKAIAALKQAHHASIEIEFRNRHDQLAPFSGVSILSGAGKRAITPNKNGVFRSIVSPSSYSLALPEHIWMSSYDGSGSGIDTAPVTLAPGQCAQIALVEATTNN